ncbi:MAG: ABC transporter permease [Eubacterium sp.]|nr:ABC transporter permease [Eubacterium sp.]
MAHFIVTQIIMLLVTISTIRGFLSLKPYEVLDITTNYSLNIAGSFSVLFVLESFILAVTVFREIYSKRASDFYFSMPVKRGTYYNTNMLFGVINIALAYVISFVLSVIVIKTDIIYPSKFYIFDISHFARVIFISLLAVLAVFAVFMLCAVVSGKKWHYVLLSFIAVLFSFVGIIELIGYINTIWGLWIDISKAWIVSPLGVLLSNVEEISAGQTAILCTVAIIQFLIAYVIGFIVFKKRKAEVAEFTLAGRIIPAIMIIGCLVTVFFINLNVVDIPLYSRIISGIIAAAVITVILTAICYKKAITKGALKCLGGAVIITAIVIACVELVPSADYIKYVPEASEVDSVTIYNDVDYSNPDITDLLYGSAFYGYYDDYSDDSVHTYTFSSDEAKKRFYDFHKKIVADETQNNAYGDDYYNYGDHSIKIKYNLKNGKTVTRSYCVGTHDVYKEYVALMKTDEGLNQLEPFNLESDSVLFAYLSNYDDYYYVDYESDDDFSTFITLDEYHTLFDKMKNDRMNDSTRKFIEYTDSGFYMWYVDYEDYDEPEETVSRLILYTFSDSVSQEEREKLSEMTPDEIINYEDMHMLNSDYNAPRILETYEFIFDGNDKETNSYLNELGYKVDFAA